MRVARKQIMLVAGEASGDVHGADLVRAIIARDAAVTVFGVGGEQLAKTPFEALYSVSKLAGMGLVELLGNVKNLWNAYRLLRRTLRERRPNLLILIDFPEFNLRLARLGKGLGVPVLYYISPQVWAWRKGRIGQIARVVDRMAVVFPFEESLYGERGVKVSFVGHPLLDIVKTGEDRDAVLRRLGLQTDTATIALLPGSREKEIAYHLPVLLQAALRLSRERKVQFICVRASTIDRAQLTRAMQGLPLAIPMVEDRRYDAVNAADLVWTASGTATLETALLLKPMVIVYRLSWLTYALARRFVDVEHIGIVNIIAGERVAPELIQADLTVQRLVEESRRILDDRTVRDGIVRKLAAVKGKLGAPGAAGRVADLALSMMSSPDLNNKPS